MTEYPEHEKMKAVADKAQIIGEFLDEGLDAQKLVLADKGGDGFGRIFPTSKTVPAILADYFGIDLKKVEAEKNTMLEEMRQARMAVELEG